MKIQKHAIPDHLKVAIHSIWMVEDEVTRQATQQVQAFPHGFVYISVNAGEKFRIFHGNNESSTETKCYLCGQTTRPSMLEIPNVHRSLVIRFHPWVVPVLFGVSSADITDSYISLEFVDAEFNDQLEELIEGRFPFDEIASKIEMIIESRLSYDHFDWRVLSMCKFLVCQKGVANLQSISEKFNLSGRRIQQLFNDHIGVSPKKFGRIVRFNHYTYQILTNQNYEHLYDHFFDQPHFSREIKKFTGLTPKSLEDLLSNFYARKAYLHTNLFHSSNG